MVAVSVAVAVVVVVAVAVAVVVVVVVLVVVVVAVVAAVAFVRNSSQVCLTQQTNCRMSCLYWKQTNKQAQTHKQTTMHA